jgi:hypothetical protein
LYLQAMVIKHAEQTTVKWQEYTVVSWGTYLKAETKSQNLCQFDVKTDCTDSKTEQDVSLVPHHYSVRGWHFKSSSGWCSNHVEEQVLFYSNGLHVEISYHDTLRQCQWNAIQFHQWCYTCKICRRNVRQWKDTSDHKVYRAGRK